MARIVGNNRSNSLDGTSRDDVIIGRAGNDRLAGHRGDDVLRGDAGNDRLGGGQGHDILKGGEGRDAFVFRSFATKDSDKITDFVTRTDRLHLDHDIFDMDVGRLSADHFFAGTRAQDAEDRFIYNERTGRLYYDDDGNGTHSQHLVATFTNHESLSARDFLFV